MRKGPSPAQRMQMNAIDPSSVLLTDAVVLLTPLQYL